METTMKYLETSLNTLQTLSKIGEMVEKMEKILEESQIKNIFDRLTAIEKKMDSMNLQFDYIETIHDGCDSIQDQVGEVYTMVENLTDRIP